jgi:hypothetical protein
MFLFTNTPTPAAPPPQAPSRAAATPVVEAIRQGAQASGTSFDYLLATAQRESALSPTAKAPTSSATGLFQFIEQTWLGLVKSEGGKLGLSEYADAITARSDGSLAVADPATKQAILKLREDPALSATLAGTLAQKNGDTLAGEIGRAPNGGDLYVAHVLGARGAAELIKSAQSTPTRAAALDFPDAAAANRNIFYDRGGRPRGAAEVYGVLTAGQSDAAATASPAAPTATASVAGAASPSDTAPLPRQAGPALYGLFQTDLRRGPVSDAVAKIWRTNASNSGVAPLAKAASFFPREQTIASLDTSEPAAVAAVAPPAVAPAAAPVAAADSAPVSVSNIPLPPPRPRTDTVQVQSAAGQAALGSPLNLLAYTKPRRS